MRTYWKFIAAAAVICGLRSQVDSRALLKDSSVLVSRDSSSVSQSGKCKEPAPGCKVLCRAKSPEPLLIAGTIVSHTMSQWSISEALET